jgi:hypothetical protein
MAGDQSLWRIALLATIYLIDFVVFIELCRDEIRAWRGGEQKARALPRRRRSDQAAIAR